ncbi:class I SAM-dependent methyltransferase [Patescibacteria group bacterium]|nr:class I SAM-dependent methyltransferase [Patescibacteria group bacterium]
MAGDKRRIETALTSITGGYGMERGEAYYLRHLHAKSIKETFDNEDVLDFGASADLNLAKTIKAAGATPKRLVSLSPAFANEMIRNTARASQAEHGLDTEIVAAMGEQLPYPDGSFTKVVIINVAEHLIHPGQFEEVVSEATRVLASGGATYMSPVHMRGDIILVATENPGEYREVLLSALSNRHPDVKFKFEREEGSRAGKTKARLGTLFIERSKKPGKKN